MERRRKMSNQVNKQQLTDTRVRQDLLGNFTCQIHMENSKLNMQWVFNSRATVLHTLSDGCPEPLARNTVRCKYQQSQTLSQAVPNGIRMDFIFHLSPKLRESQ